MIGLSYAARFRRSHIAAAVMLSLFLGVFMAGVQTEKTEAARNTSYICDRYVVASGSVNRPEGTYYTYEYGLVGNDSARYQNSESGSRINGPDADCQNWDRGPACGTYVDLLWSCNGDVDYDNAYYRAQFGGRSATRVFLGTPIRSPADKENYDPSVLDSDPSRDAPGITAQKIHPFGSVNDASIAIINGDPLFCVGLSFLHAGCRYNVLNDGVGGGPGAWAGYLNGAYPGDADRAIQNINSTYRGSVWRDENSVPLQNLVSGGSFRLQLEGVNTQDPWFSCTPVWSNGNAPSSSNSRCYNPANFPNSKAGVFITYFVPNGTPTNAEPRGTVQGACAPQARVYGRITDADNAGQIFYEVWRDALPGWGGTKVGEGYTNNNGDYSQNIPASLTSTDRNYYVIALNAISPGNNDPVLVGSVRFSCRLDCEASVITPAKNGTDSPAPGQGFTIRIRYTSSTPIDAGAILSASPGLPGITNGAIVSFPGGAATSGTLNRSIGGASANAYDVSIVVGNAGMGMLTRCDVTVKIANKPYFKVWTNDVKIGGAFEESGVCTPSQGNPLATAIGYGGSEGDSPPDSNEFSGSSVEFGLFALGEVRNVFSAGRRSDRGGEEPTPPHGLTFANASIDGLPSGDPDDPAKALNYGGGSRIEDCARDWFSPDLVPNSVTNLPSTFFFTGAGGSGATRATRTSGNFYINSGTVTGPRSIFVPSSDVDVVISGNITANDGATMYIIANGDIRISKNVTRIDAVLISKKRVITCTEGNGTLIAASDLYEECGGDDANSKLIIRGAVVAQELKLLRTFGTREDSAKNEGSTLSGSVGNDAAEEIIFDPTLYRASPALRTPGTQGAQFDFITSLPPIL